MIKGRLGKSQDALKGGLPITKTMERPRVLGGGNLNIFRINSARDSHKNNAFATKKQSQNLLDASAKQSQEAGCKTQRHMNYQTDRPRPSITNIDRFQQSPLEGQTSNMALAKLSICINYMLQKILVYQQETHKRIRKLKRRSNRNGKHDKKKPDASLDKVARN